MAKDEIKLITLKKLTGGNASHPSVAENQWRTRKNEKRTLTFLPRTDRLHQRNRLPAPAQHGRRRLVGRRSDGRRLPIHPPARRRMGMAPLDVEGRHPSGERMRLRQVLPKQGGLYQPRMVAGLLQLSPERLPPPRRRKHRRKHPRHPADRREPHHPRPAGGL